MSPPPKKPKGPGLRNIGIIAHIDAGKTTLTERILYYSGRTHKLGEVHDGEAVMDFMPEEQDRGITIMSAVTSCEWRGAEVNIIDTPGHVDFTMEVERSLRVLDGAVGVFCAVGGVQPQSETVWRQADRHRVPKLVFVNKMDRTGADFDKVMDELRDRLSARPLVITRPVGREEGFKGVVDLLNRSYCTWSEDSLGAEMTQAPIPEELEADAEKERRELIETLADCDDEVMEAYLADAELDVPALKAAIRRATIALKLVPAFAGAALRNKGVQPLLDGVVDYLPAPRDLPPVEALDLKGGAVMVEPDEKAPLAALVFKIQMMEQGRKLSYVRVYSGEMKEGGEVFNSRMRRKDKISRLFRISAAKRDRTDRASAGDLVGVVGLRSAATGDTVCSEDRPVVLESIQAADPVISIAVEPESSSDGPRLLEALSKMAEEDPTFRMKQDPDTGQTVISGMGELYLEILVHRLGREHGVQVVVGKPQVVHRETVQKAATADGAFQRPAGAASKAAKAVVTVKPLPRGKGVSTANLVAAAGLLPKNLVDAAFATVKDSLETGPLLGYPMLDIEASLDALEIGEGGADEPSVRIAAAQAARNALNAASPILMEPVMKLEVTCPEESVGDVVGEIAVRNGRVGEVKPTVPPGFMTVSAAAPLASMFGYSTTIRSQTQGRGSFLLTFDRYDVVERKGQERP
ncbi:MAG: elongation factor G [Deltaproteobacteria bacterium]|jgi:elongation factor G|nr:elongation factor G [Deltaproteobacteria bacterium]